MRPISRRGTLGRSIPPITATALGIATLAACGSVPAHTAPAHTAPAHTTRTHATPAPTGTAGRHAARLEVLSATFVSARTGWALGAQPCQGAGCPRLELRMTTDRGRHWFAVPTPPAGVAAVGGRSAADAVSTVRFADTKDGWAFGPGLWATHDGGHTWHRIGTHGLAVRDLAAGDGRVIAALGRCPAAAADCRRFQVFSSPVTADRWRPVPGTAGTGVIGGITVAAGTGYLAAVTQPRGAGRPAMTLLAGPADSAVAWRRLAAPCPAAFRVFATLAATPRRALAVGCGSEPGAGSQRKRVYYSPTGGRSWRRLADPPAGGYLGRVSITAAGTIVLSGGRSDVYLSWDGGRTWHTSPSLDQAAGLAGAGFSLDAAMTTSTQGFAIQEGRIYRRQMWFTSDAGHTWTPVTLH
jgi:hypothetical protein